MAIWIITIAERNLSVSHTPQPERVAGFFCQQHYPGAPLASPSPIRSSTIKLWPYLEGGPWAKCLSIKHL
jgi:hypothetical protein